MDWYAAVLKKYAEFGGRARRKEYWYFTLFHTLISLFLLVAGGLATEAGMVLYAVYTLATLLPVLAVTVRRLHDTDKSGWWLLIGLLPFGGLVILVFTLMEGTSGPNSYGDNPKAAAPVVFAGI